MASGDGTAEIVLGLLFLIGGLITLFVEAIPVICYGAVIFGPILMVSGFIKAAKSRRPAPVPLAYFAYRSPPYAPPPPSPPTGGAVSIPPEPTPAAPSRKCPTCVSENRADAKFCTSCGAAF